MLYVDPSKLESHQMSLMDVVRAINESNVVLPAGDVQIGRYDYNIYANSQVDERRRHQSDSHQGESAPPPYSVSDIGIAKDAYSLQYNAVRVDGQRSVYLPVLKQGGDSNTIQVVDGVRADGSKSCSIRRPPSRPRWSSINRSSSRRRFRTLLHEGGVGLFLTCLMILMFLGSMRATVAVFFSIPISALATLIALANGWQLHQHHGAWRAWRWPFRV